ncbi:thioredoxin [Heliobacillus mobilis]|uniref:Thioredoxin n=1 Tax=Heliobacterium mobile TaxID=28064 RepID=A0A6I3SLQ4_HELMO|nr:thioredoxin [Heliobacterium mobile]MTV49873.1 thioredoxin [Heliobacterium mobile]
MASANVLTLTDENFQSTVLEADKTVLVDFWADWCGPCKMMTPIIDKLADQLDGKALIGKLNIDENRHTPAKYGIRSIPTLLIFKNGQVVDQSVGAKTNAQVRSLLEKNL